jgi:hypothetical protein
MDLVAQTLDLYLDTDGKPGSGQTQALPGRRVRIHPEFAWERALVLTARPRVFASWLAVVAPELEAITQVASRLELRRGCMVARFPLGALGRPQPGWGLTAVLSGARFYPTFRIGDRLSGSYRQDEFTREVQAEAGICSTSADDILECPFGGCQPCGLHPRVIDLLGCGSQQAQLSSYDTEAGLLAQVSGRRLGPDGRGSCPIDAAEGPGPARPGQTSGAAPGYRVADRAGELLSLVGGPARAPGELGELLDRDGQVLGRIVVTGVAGQVTLVQMLPGVPVPVDAVGARFGKADEAQRDP